MTRKRPRKTEAPKDFPKKKQKVGKGKSTPENVTVVNFKSRSVVVPGQLQRTIEPTTHKKLTLQVRVCVCVCACMCKCVEWVGGWVHMCNCMYATMLLVVSALLFFIVFVSFSTEPTDPDWTLQTLCETRGTKRNP